MNNGKVKENDKTKENNNNVHCRSTLCDTADPNHVSCSDNSSNANKP